MNRCTLMGRLGSDAEVRVLQNGSAVLKFSIATSEKWIDKQSGEKKEKTEWHRCAYFSKGAEKLAQYLTKGSQIAVEGSIQYGSYEKDNVKHYTTDIKVQQLHFCGSKSEGGQRQDNDSAPTSSRAASAESDFGDYSHGDIVGASEIPF